MSNLHLISSQFSFLNLEDFLRVLSKIHQNLRKYLIKISKKNLKNSFQFYSIVPLNILQKYLFRKVIWNFSENFFAGSKYFFKIFTENISNILERSSKFFRNFLEIFSQFNFRHNRKYEQRNLYVKNGTISYER